MAENEISEVMLDTTFWVHTKLVPRLLNRFVKPH